MSSNAASSTKSKAVAVEDLRFSYPTSGEVLKGINLQVREGEFVCITGPTGAGKTTLCMCIKGLIPHTQPGKMNGRVLVHGQDTRQVAPGKLAETVGMVFQDAEAQIVGLTVSEDLAFGPENYEVPPEDILRRIPQVLETVRLSGYEERETYGLSGGEKQRVAIAGALMMMPKVLILDEPTAELDPVGKSEILKVLRTLRDERGMTIIVVEHALEQLAELADRIIVMDQGQIVADDAPRSLFRQLELLQTSGERVPQVAELLSYLEHDGLVPNGSVTPYESEAIEVLAGVLQRQGATKAAVWHNQAPVNEVHYEGGPIIEVQDVSFKYDIAGADTYALRHANLKVKTGEFLAFVGQNGAGKTTLAKLLNGTLKPMEGTVLVQGRDTKKESVEKLAPIVGYCYQNPDHQIFAGTVYEEVAFGPRNVGLSREEVNKRVMETLETVGLADRKDVYPFVLGRGERQILAVASVAAMGVQVLVVDEPTTGLDHTGSRKIMNLLTEWNKRGRTVIVITHDMNIVAEYVPRMVVLASGHIVADGPTRSVFVNSEALSKAYLSPPQVTRVAQKLANYGVPPDLLTVQEFYAYLKNRAHC